MNLRKIFGTDGMRGEANTWPIIPEMIMKLAMATAHHFINKIPVEWLHGDHRFTVVIGKDTRLSGYMVESALVSGFVAMGANVILLGPLPTPAVAMLTRSLRANLGVMISASHNPYQDNGIKFFDANGYKFSKDEEGLIEGLMQTNIQLAPAAKIGRAKRLDDAAGRYIEFVKATFPRGQRLDGLKIVIDCAHGAAYKVAPKVLWELGADIIPIGVEPDGININSKCGATDVTLLKQTVLEKEADIGIALDGDADRLIMVDEKGNTLDGDQLMALIATVWLEKDLIRGGGIVATEMSNLGLEHYLEDKNIKLYRSEIGDRPVTEMMRTKGCNIGGEQSGHIILSDYTTTGDALIAALQVLSLMQAKKITASALGHTFTPTPQILENIRVEKSFNLKNANIENAILNAKEELGGNGRLLVRPSGTEPLIRIMAQGNDRNQLLNIIDKLKNTIQNCYNLAA